MLIKGVSYDETSCDNQTRTVLVWQKRLGVQLPITTISKGNQLNVECIVEINNLYCAEFAEGSDFNALYDPVDEKDCRELRLYNLHAKAARHVFVKLGWKHWFCHEFPGQGLYRYFQTDTPIGEIEEKIQSKLKIGHLIGFNKLEQLNVS